MMQFLFSLGMLVLLAYSHFLAMALGVMAHAHSRGEKTPVSMLSTVTWLVIVWVLVAILHAAAQWVQP